LAPPLRPVSGRGGDSFFYKFGLQWAPPDKFQQDKRLPQCLCIPAAALRRTILQTLHKFGSVEWLIIVENNTLRIWHA
jgi:hypothetical protein